MSSKYPILPPKEIIKVLENSASAMFRKREVI